MISDKEVTQTKLGLPILTQSDTDVYVRGKGNNGHYVRYAEKTLASKGSVTLHGLGSAIHKVCW